MKRISQAEFLEEAKRRFGANPRQWKFVCPSCGTVQAVQEFFDAGLDKEQVHRVIGYSCIGRFARGKGCDWTLGGLFQIHTLEVAIEDGFRPTFELGPAETAKEAA